MGMLLDINPAKVTNFLYQEPSKVLVGAPRSVTARPYRNRRDVGLVVPDSVLRVGRALRDCLHVRATFQRFFDGLDWIETDYLSLYERRYKRQQLLRNDGTTFDDFRRKKLDRYDQIFADMKANGFQEAQSLEDNVEIAWCADGQPLLSDGRHRLAFA